MRLASLRFAARPSARPGGRCRRLAALLFTFKPRLSPLAKCPLALLEVLAVAHVVEHPVHFGNRLERPSRYGLARQLFQGAHDQRRLHISVTAALTPGLPGVFVDGHQIQQVLLNLVINAEQAMQSAHGRGALHVQTSFDERRRRVTIEVADDGPGVSSLVKDRIFDPFFTTKAAGEGTGLGLTVAHAIVRDR